MKTFKKLLVIIITSIVVDSCRDKTANFSNKAIEIKEDSLMIRSRWFFYSYAIEQNAVTDSEHLPVNILECKTKLRGIIKDNIDSIRIFYTLFYKDSFKTCTLTPLDVRGVLVVKNKYFSPIYHSVQFNIWDSEDSTEKYMKVYEDFLSEKIRETPNAIPWLKEYSKNR